MATLTLSNEKQISGSANTGAQLENFWREGDTKFSLIYRVKFLWAAGKVPCKLFSCPQNYDQWSRGGGEGRGGTKTHVAPLPSCANKYALLL